MMRLPRRDCGRSSSCSSAAKSGVADDRTGACVMTTDRAGSNEGGKTRPQTVPAIAQQAIVKRCLLGRASLHERTRANAISAQTNAMSQAGALTKVPIDPRALAPAIKPTSVPREPERSARSLTDPTPGSRSSGNEAAYGTSERGGDASPNGSRPAE